MEERIYSLTNHYIFDLVSAILECDKKLRELFDTLSDEKRAALISEAVIAEMEKQRR